MNIIAVHTGVWQKWVYSCEYAKQFILVLFLLIIILFSHVDNWKPAFAHPWI